MKPLMLAITLFLLTQPIEVNARSASEKTLKEKSFTIIHKLQTRAFCKNLREEIHYAQTNFNAAVMMIRTRQKIPDPDLSSMAKKKYLKLLGSLANSWNAFCKN
tara:strand:- start:72 stop:383 length:312 start_codon:yes stop_codon:yes gene_type:complete